jgi:hypothetical protein
MLDSFNGLRVSINLVDTELKLVSRIDEHHPYISDLQ